MKRIVTVHASAGSGHRSVAQAINTALALQGNEAILADILSFASPSFQKFYGRGYELSSQHLRWLCRLVYGSTDSPAQHSALVNFIEKSSAAKVQGFAVFLKENNIDTVCCTHFLPMRLVADLRRRGLYKGELQVCVTDYQVHGFWHDPDVDKYQVATPQAAERLISWGIAEKRIQVTGIPVRQIFTEPHPHEEAKEPWRVLLLGSSLKVGEVTRYLADLAALSRPLKLTLVAGRNQALLSALKNYSPPPQISFELRGLEPRLDLFMAESDFIVTKPGGIICSEALCMGLPMLFVSPIPLHEIHNAEILTRAGAGLICFGEKTLQSALQNVIGQPDKLRAMRQAALSLAKPNAAKDIAAALLA